MSNQQLTTPINPHQEVVGHIVNSGLSERAQVAVRRVQDKLETAFPEAIWSAPSESLHITLMDWTAPLVDYSCDKDELFRSLETEYTKALADSIKDQPPIHILFDSIEVHPAAIIIKGSDNGSYQRIRTRFLDKVDLSPGTKEPPQIVHTTICKFIKGIEVDAVKRALQNEVVHFEEDVSEFRLVRESRIFLQKYEVLRRFKLDS